MNNSQNSYKKIFTDVVERLRYRYDYALNIKELEAIIHNEDTPKEAYYYLAQSYQALQKCKKADIYFEKASKLFFNFPKLYLCWAENNAAFSKKSALEIVEKGITLFPKNKKLHIHRAWICNNKKMQSAYFEDLKVIFPNDKEILEQRVEYFLNDAPKTLKNRFDLVIEDCSQLITSEANMKDDNYITRLAWAYIGKREYQKAENILLDFLQKYQDTIYDLSNTIHCLICFYEDIEEYDKAIFFLKESLATKWNINFQIILGRMYMHNKDFENALNCFDSIVKIPTYMNVSNIKSTIKQYKEECLKQKDNL